MKRLIVLAMLGLAACAAAAPPRVLMPGPTPVSTTYFANGQPVALVRMPGCSMLLAAAPCTVGGKDYLRVWWLVRNESDQPVDLQPLQDLAVTSRHMASHDSSTARPEAPSRILKRIANEEAVRVIAQSFGGALEAASASTHHAGSDPDRIRDRTEDAVERTQLGYALYAQSISQGILRRNTVLPGQAVNGFVYVPFTGTVSATSGALHVKVRKPAPFEAFDHVVTTRVGERTASVVFTPAAGE